MATVVGTVTFEVNNLDELLGILRDRTVELDSNTMTSLPTFGGEEPKDTMEVWSWDETRLLVGACASDYQIVSREEWAAK